MGPNEEEKKRFGDELAISKVFHREENGSNNESNNNNNNVEERIIDLEKDIDDIKIKAARIARTCQEESERVWEAFARMQKSMTSMISLSSATPKR